MDIARPDLAKKKRRKMTLYVGIGVVAVGAVQGTGEKWLCKPLALKIAQIT
jgi:hypothetical protein